MPEATLGAANAIADRGLASAGHRGLAEVYLAAGDPGRAVDHASRALSGAAACRAGEWIVGLTTRSSSETTMVRGQSSCA